MLEGKVYKSTGSWYLVKSKNKFFECRIKGKIRLKDISTTNPISVGDDVIFEIEDQNTGIISDILPRSNYIIRKSVKLSKQYHIIASNIDLSILVVTLENPVTTNNFIDRFLVSAQAFGVEVILLFNKVDIYDKLTLLELENLKNIYTQIGYKCISVSVIIDELNELQDIIKAKNTLISGHSGVGKSTLINKLFGTDIPTNEISPTHEQGQHTTTFSHLYKLNNGGAIIDTPGIKGFGLIDIETKDICDLFPEFFKLKSNCKFNNCIHLNEPNCKVLEALANGKISKHRYQNYLNMLENEESIYRSS